jgi:hypothetical protein
VIFSVVRIQAAFSGFLQCSTIDCRCLIAAVGLSQPSRLNNGSLESSLIVYTMAEPLCQPVVFSG